MDLYDINQHLADISKMFSNGADMRAEIDRLTKENLRLEKQVKTHGLTVQRLYKENQGLYRRIGGHAPKQ